MFKYKSYLNKFLKPKNVNCGNYCMLKRNDHNYANRDRTPYISNSHRKSLENEFMHQIILRNFIPLAPSVLKPSNGILVVEIPETFEALMDENYRANSKYTASDIVRIFQSVKSFCSLHQISIEDKRFDNLVDGLMDHCDKLTDDELLELLLCLNSYPSCSSYSAYNFHDVWSCLDDMCCGRLADNDLDYLFQLADAWYQLDLGKIGDYIFNFLDFIAKKAHKLNKDQIVKYFFYTNVCRRRSIPFEIEGALEKYLKQLNVDELGVVALGYFKSMSKIKLNSIVLRMIEAIKDEYSTVDQITLASLLKAIRYSKPGNMVGELNKMLDTLTDQIDRLSPQCCLQIAIIGSSIIHFHKNTMQKSIQKIVNVMDDVTKVRLKDMERILSATTMVDFRPNIKPDLFQIVFEEIHKNQRQREIIMFPKILPCILNYFSIINMYSYQLMDKVLCEDFISEIYGKGLAAVPRDIFALDCCIDIECSGYHGKRLSPQVKYRLVKWVLEFTPSRDQYTALNAYDKLFLEVKESIEWIIGNKTAVRPDHVVPHFPRADIILCKRKTTNQFVEPPGFERYILGDIKYPMKDPNLLWYTISIVGWNNTIRSTSLPVGLIVMKQRHLRKLGYISKLVIWNQFMPLNKKDKMSYLKYLLSK